MKKPARKLVLAVLLLLPAVAVAQTRRDTCHVYVVDVAKARQTAASFRESGDPKADAKALSAGQTVFPEFYPTIGEEQLTTKTYRFPKSNLTIAASVFYTDESMASSKGNDSMLLGIVVSRKAERDATSASNNAVTEVTYNDSLDTVRAKKFLTLNGRQYLVGLECRFQSRSNP